MRWKAFSILILLTISIYLSGCNFMPSPDNTIASPRPKKNISSSNEDISSIITGFIPSSTKLLVPKASEDREPIHKVDLDGDGTSEIILTYMDEKQIIQSGFMVLKKGEHIWLKQFEETDQYRTINMVDFKDITGDNLPEIFIGKENMLNIYHYNGNLYKLIASIPYTEYTSSDIAGEYEKDTMTELIVYNKIISEPVVNILRWNGYILQNVTEEFPNYKLDLIDYYMQVMKENPNRSAYWFNLSKLQMEAGKYTDSLASIEKAIFLESYPDTLIEYKIFKGRILVNLERYDEAIQLVSKDSLQKGVNIVNSKNVIAESYFKRRDYIKAREIYKEIALFPYDENIQRVDTALAQEKIYEYLNSLGEKPFADIPKLLEKFGYDNNLVINSTVSRGSVKGLSSVIIVDYHLAPVLAHGKDSVGAHLIYWWKDGQLYYKEYTTIDLYSNHHLKAYLLSTAASIRTDADGTIKMRVTFQNNQKTKNDYPDALNQTFLFVNNDWKFFWK